jgi:hypothetical protein
MMKIAYENTFGNHLKIDGVIARFYDQIAGKKDCNMNNEWGTWGENNESYTSKSEWSDGTKLTVEIYWHDGKDEWVAQALESESLNVEWRKNNAEG